MFTFGLSLKASAQNITYDDAVGFYHASNQINNEVWLNNPNQLEASRHMLIILRNWGFYPGFEPAEINPSLEPDGSVGTCMWIQNENGDWEERCNDWHSMARCYSARFIRDATYAKDGMWWFA